MDGNFHRCVTASLSRDPVGLSQGHSSTPPLIISSDVQRMKTCAGPSPTCYTARSSRRGLILIRELLKRIGRWKERRSSQPSLSLQRTTGDVDRKNRVDRCRDKGKTCRFGRIRKTTNTSVSKRFASGRSQTDGDLNHSAVGGSRDPLAEMCYGSE